MFSPVDKSRLYIQFLKLILKNLEIIVDPLILSRQNWFSNLSKFILKIIFFERNFCAAGRQVYKKHAPKGTIIDTFFCKFFCKNWRRRCLQKLLGTVSWKWMCIITQENLLVGEEVDEVMIGASNLSHTVADLGGRVVERIFSPPPFRESTPSPTKGSPFNTISRFSRHGQYIWKDVISWKQVKQKELILNIEAKFLSICLNEFSANDFRSLIVAHL